LEDEALAVSIAQDCSYYFTAARGETMLVVPLERDSEQVFPHPCTTFAAVLSFYPCMMALAPIKQDSCATANGIEESGNMVAIP